jgi:hypothetical protein
MIEIDDKHKQVLQYAVQAYYEEYIEMKKEKLAELEGLNASLSEMETILALLGVSEKPENSLKEVAPKPESPAQIKQTETEPAHSNSKPSDLLSTQTQPQLQPHPMRPVDLKLSAFEFDKTKMQWYKPIQFLELPDGRVVICYSNSHYYTSKDAVMQIPYPIPKGYFSKENGWSSTIEQAFKNYRKYLAEIQQQEQEKTVVGGGEGVISPASQTAIESDARITKEDIFIDKFEYDPTQKKEINGYSNYSVVELPDGRAMIYSNRNGSHYYTTKEMVLKMPYPVPVSYFIGTGLSTVAISCIRAYRHYLEHSNGGDGSIVGDTGGTSQSEQDKQEVTGMEQPLSIPSQSRLAKLKELATPCITKDDLVEDWFECDPSQGKKINGYNMCKVVEMPDGRAMVQYDRVHYYTSKEKVMNIPYPVPKGYLNGSGLSSNAEVCIRAYRHYLESPHEEKSEDSVNANHEPSAIPNEDKHVEQEQLGKPRLEFFKEDSGFDYSRVNPQYIGGSTVYMSAAGKLVVKYQGKNTQGELLLTRTQDIEKLMDYDEKDVDWAIRGLSAEKRNILRGYLKDLKAVNRVAQ